MSKIILLGAEEVSYTNRRGEEVNRLILHYFDPSEVLKSRIERGYRLLNQDVYGTFNASDFEYPGEYEVKVEPVRGLGGKLAAKFSEIRLVNRVTFENKGYLFLGVKKVDFESSDGKAIKGLKCFFINLNDLTELGYLPLEAFVSSSKVALTTIPAYYQCDFDQIRGMRGAAMLRIIPESFVMSSDFVMKAVA